MNLMSKPEDLRSVRKNTRFILNKLKEITRNRTYQRVLSKKLIAQKQGKSVDVLICIHQILEVYRCYLAGQFNDPYYPKRKQEILFNSLMVLEEEINKAVKNNKPVPKKYVSNILRAHTMFFNQLKSKKINKKCEQFHSNLILAGIAVWNNKWPTMI